ncbi:MAG TPA: 50S ribosomal protein L29 [Patescibacteria group bacterium]|nr:50S ribosomal protein L29 [Patescibacteria group bacterium]
MKISELREKTDLELDRMLADFRNKVRDLRFRVTARQLSDVREIREARKAIAQILTLKRSRRKD